FTMVDGYIQDNWKVNRRLSLEFGLRLQHNPPLYSQENNVANFDARLYDPSRVVALTAAGLIVPNSGNPYNGLIRAGSGVPSDQLGRVPGATSPQTLSVPTGAPRGLYEVSELLLAPRFSFAWSPVDNKTAIRGGFGLFYDHPDGNVFYNALLTPPYVQ